MKKKSEKHKQIQHHEQIRYIDCITSPAPGVDAIGTSSRSSKNLEELSKAYREAPPGATIHIGGVVADKPGSNAIMLSENSFSLFNEKKSASKKLLDDDNIQKTPPLKNNP